MLTETPQRKESTFSDETYARHKRVIERVLAEGERRIHQDCERAMAAGIIDSNGNLLRADLPADMQPGADRDFGG